MLVVACCAESVLLLLLLCHDGSLCAGWSREGQEVLLNDGRANGELLLSTGSLQDANTSDCLSFPATLIGADRCAVQPALGLPAEEQIGASVGQRITSSSSHMCCQVSGLPHPAATWAARSAAGAACRVDKRCQVGLVTRLPGTCCFTDFMMWVQ
jgi:hypothetical protein